MTYTDKILAEFNERFNKPLRSDINKFINREGDIHTYLDLSDIKSFLTTKIAQALAEDRERVRGVIELVKTNIAWQATAGIDADSGDDAKQIGWDGACDLILSSLDKLTDKE